MAQNSTISARGDTRNVTADKTHSEIGKYMLEITGSTDLFIHFGCRKQQGRPTGGLHVKQGD